MAWKGGLTAIVAAFVAACGAARAGEPTGIGPSGLAVPRFVSLKFDEIKVRRGPTPGHEVIWTFVKAGLPVEVVQEFDTWRRIRDAEGQEGWVQQSQLAGRRTAIVMPWKRSQYAELREAPSATAKIVALIEPNVLARVKSCDGAWCDVEGKNFEGYIEQTRLFGVYPREVVK